MVHISPIRAHSHVNAIFGLANALIYRIWVGIILYARLTINFSLVHELDGEISWPSAFVESESADENMFLIQFCCLSSPFSSNTSPR